MVAAGWIAVGPGVAEWWSKYLGTNKLDADNSVHSGTNALFRKFSGPSSRDEEARSHGHIHLYTSNWVSIITQ